MRIKKNFYHGVHGVSRRKRIQGIGIGDWGLGIRDQGLGIRDQGIGVLLGSVALY